MQVGDLVTIHPHVQPPPLYGVGLVIEVEHRTAGYHKPMVAVKIKWSKLPDNQPRFTWASNVERLWTNENR